MQNLSIPTVALTKLTQWQAYYISFFERISALQQARKISAIEHRVVTAYLDNLNQALKYYFSLKTLPRQTDRLQSLLAYLQIFAEPQKSSPFLSELLAEFKALLIATKEKLLTPMEIETLPPEILNQIASDNFTSRQALNLAQCSPLLFFGDAGLSFFAKRKRLLELGKFKLTIGHISSFLSFQNKLFVWGDNSFGQFGLGWDNDTRNVPVEFELARLQLASEDEVAQVVAGASYTVLITRQGRCFVWGNNACGQLGLGWDNDTRNVPVEFDLTRLQLAPGDSVAQVIAGEYHTILLTQQGRCFVWGRNQEGQLGLADNRSRNVPAEFNLTRLQLAPGDGVAQVVAGATHTTILTRQGRCFVWGSNRHGQLGLGDNVDRNVPVEFDLTRLQLAPEDGVGQIAAGRYYTVLLTQQGRCFVWGENPFGQLGLGDNDDRNIPVEFDLARLQLAPGDGVTQVIAGGAHNILFTRQGRCFVWGNNDEGQLGLGDNVNRNVPVELNLAPLQIAPGDAVAQVVAGDSHNILLTRQGRCFVWGSNYVGQLGLGWYHYVFVSTPTEVFYPHLKELKNLWSSLQKEDLITLASLACDEENYGRTTYQLIVKRLASENIETRLSIICLIQASPWHQPHLVTKLLPFASLYEPLIETLKVKFSKEQQLITHALAKLFDIFNYFIDKNVSSEQEDFVELLKTLCQGGLQDSDAFSKYLEKTATRHLKNFGFTVLGLSVDSPIPLSSAGYFTVRQELLTEAKQQPEFLSHLTTAADILLQGLNVATEADGLAYTLRKILQSNQQPRPTPPGAALGS